ncbi:MAG: DEAD/DEAH box helicase family protein [Candidatus Ancillula trichonymphae]|nr:DEAD/DEAH box helicase family protein [Candidatus Ancillula trichonymphae]
MKSAPDCLINGTGNFSVCFRSSDSSTSFITSPCSIKAPRKSAAANQYFGIKKAQMKLGRKQGGIIWHTTQGSGKTLTMVWLPKWILAANPDARVLIVTDRDELDEQMEKVYKGVDETSKYTVPPLVLTL